jgi:transcriptional regulator of arginine metabolism
MEVMKRLRQQQIRDIVTSRPIRTQHELAAALRERGVQATQATVSRDVSEMGLVKLDQDGVQAYAPPQHAHETEISGEERLRRIMHDLPIEIRQAGLLLVVRTVPGSAHALAAALDRAQWPEVVGSVAGDDTVFIAFAEARLLAVVERRLARLAGE